MLQLRVTCPTELTAAVIEVFSGGPAVSQLAVHRGASISPAGDIVVADVAREGADDLVERLRALGIPESGTIHIQPVATWLSDAGLRAERRVPGAGADAVVWAEVTQRAYEDSQLNWIYLAFMTLATLLASVAIVIDSQILVIGAMVLGPEFITIAALGLALVRRRRRLFVSAARTLVVGFAVAIVIATLAGLVARALGWVTKADVTGARSGTSFIYSPDKWSFIVAVIAAVAGVLSLTSAKVGGLSGVFISVTTVPAAGNVALGLAFGARGEILGSAAQLALNVSGMILAGWLTLATQQAVRKRIDRYRHRVAEGS